MSPFDGLCVVCGAKVDRGEARCFRMQEEDVDGIAVAENETVEAVICIKCLVGYLKRVGWKTCEECGDWFLGLERDAKCDGCEEAWV